MPSQQSSMQYQYALTEIYNETIHGRTEDSAPDIDNHILCTYTFEPEEVMEENINKLEKRYPNGFEVHRSENREAGDL